MFFFRSTGLRGLGETPTAGYCFLNGVWTWTTADKCPQPLIEGGAPVIKSGFCWIRQNPPDAFPGYWARARVGQACQYEGPPSAPTVAAGWCQNPTTGQWEYVLATQCAQPIQASPGIPRLPGGRTVSEYRSRRTLNTMIAQFVERWAARRHDVIMGLYATDQVKPCVDVMGARADAWCKAEFARGNFRVLDPIGVIVELGVAFSPEELSAGFLERAYTPTPEQQFMADIVVYGTSQLRLAFTAAAGAFKIAGDLPSSTDFWLSPLYALLGNTDPDNEFLRSVGRSQLSIQQFIKNHPSFTYEVPGFSLNPDPPTTDELTQEGGLLAYYRRGGYLLSTECAAGTVPSSLAGITWNTGYCACGEGGTPMATFKRAAGEGFGWDVYVTVGPQYKIRITPHDAPWWSEAASFVAGKLKDLAKFICSNREIIQQVNSGVLLKEICTNPDGTPCTKGAAGCTCTQPTTVQQGAVGVANVVMGAWCSRVETWDKPKETPFTPPPPEVKAVRWPFVVTGLVGAIVGGLFASRTRR